ncbi:MAG: histidine--tRNA ligase [Candidatus Riflebacteria bacterium]|nr:histidine--tRNA ligase [Candidatus Riflebacteria bacterium]
MAISTKPPSGMRDFLPAELVRRRFVVNTIQQTYEKYGFVPVETPSIENLSTLLGKYGDEGDQLLFRILHRRDKLVRALENPEVSEKDLADLGLRYDLTVPLARLIANNPELPKFFKRYQIQPVWRADRPGRGRFREFWQCDVDITGSKSLIAEAEVCSAVAEVLLNLGFSNFEIHLNHRQLLKCLIKAAGIELENEAITLVAVDKLDKIGAEGVEKELEQRGISAAQTTALLKLIQRPCGIDETGELLRLKNALAGNDEAVAAITQLTELCLLLNNSKAAGHYSIDASLARGLGYYTGPIFEIRSSDFSGSLGGGGRYDGLIGMFKGSEIPAVGFSIGFERLLLVLEEKGLFGTLACGPDVVICHFDDVADAAVLEAASNLREHGVKVEIYPETPKLGKQIAYAESIGAAWVAIMGASEAAEKLLSLKNLTSGEQQQLNYKEAAERINRR